MKAPKPFEKSQPIQAQENHRIVSITELAWAVSRILNFVHRTQQSVWVTNRGRIIATISPAPGHAQVADQSQEWQGIES